MTDGQTAHDHYATRIAQIRAQEHALRQRSRWLTRWRGLTFLPAVALVIYAWVNESPGHISYAIASLLMVAFVILVGVHERLSDELAALDQRRVINEQQILRRARHWANLPVPEVEMPPDATPLARDLDLTGSASILQWLCVAQTPLGVLKLRDWLIQPADAGATADRQEAVRHLTGETGLREELQLRCRLAAADGQGAMRFLQWAESPGWLATHRSLTWSVRGLTALMLLLVLAVSFTGRVELLLAIAVLLVTHLVINLRFVPPIHELFDVVAARRNGVSQYRAALTLLHQLPEHGTKFAEIRRALGHDALGPLRCLDDLNRRVRLAAARHSSLWGIPYLCLQWFVMWDFHVLTVIEAWQQRHGHRARGWFEALAEFEALASLATVAFDNPTWAFAELDPQATQFTARRLGHPLLPDDVRVPNDVEVGPPGTFLLVSGSNMSGKSTLLRAVGVNVLLAQAGAPTCSTACRLPPLQVATSMRVGDSLAEGVSFYLAELRRLKQIVDQAARLSAFPPRLLYLLDEILQGTNSAERHIAVIRVVRHLLDSGAIGAMSTHDLALAASPELADACRSTHFREQIIEQDGKSVMSFDYQMRPGVATTTNALKLLELVGLG
jgi:hypothetical protein